MNFHKAADDTHYTNKHVDIITQQIHMLLNGSYYCYQKNPQKFIAKAPSAPSYKTEYTETCCEN